MGNRALRFDLSIHLPFLLKFGNRGILFYVLLRGQSRNRKPNLLKDGILPHIQQSLHSTRGQIVAVEGNRGQAGIELRPNGQIVVSADGDVIRNPDFSFL